GDLSVITWTGSEATRVHTFAGELKPSKDWKRINVQDVYLRARVTCLAPFYGEDCDTICKSPSEKQKKILGHYSCNKNGEKVCDPNFRTEIDNGFPCLQRICPESAPDHCAECNQEGRCKKCEPTHYLEGGTCKLENPCAPSNGRKVCSESSTCIAKGYSYQCIMPIEAPIAEPCSASCANNGVCYDGNKCACPEGFAGEFCEVQEKDNLLLGVVAGIMLSVLGALLCITGFIARRRSQMHKATTDIDIEEGIIEEAAHSRAEGALLLSESTLQAAYSKPCSPAKATKNQQEDSFATSSSDMSLSAPPSYNEALQS
ncbi:unnamed protein product, partial [Oikopleura dioica]